jgi:Conserved phage C-terminus (Phg_2220_C)
MAHYLQPATLFNSTKFAQYVGALGARMPPLTPMRPHRSEKFDPVARINQKRTERSHERNDDFIDV